MQNAFAHTPPASRLQILLLFAYGFGVLAYVQFAGPAIVGYDGYYHIKVADLMRERGWVLEFPWLSLTVLDAAHYADHHWLLHVLQVPFTGFFDDLADAAKWSAVSIAAAAFAVYGWLLLRYRVPLAPVWMFTLFAASSPFLYRMSMARGQALALALQLAAAHLLLQKRPLGLALLAALFVLAYDGFLILLPLLSFALIAHYAVERRIEYKLAAALVIGIGAGLLVHPYFPNNVVFLWHHVVPKFFATGPGIRVGSEWYPYNTWQWFSESAVAITAFLAALLFTRTQTLKTDKAQLFWLLAAGMYFLLYLKSRRFAEYFAPAAVMALAVTGRGFLARLDGRWLKRHRWATAGLAAAAAGIAASFVLVLSETRGDIRRQRPVDAFRPAALYLKNHTRPGELIFHADWDDFPRLFYHNTHNRYLVGLDPDFMRRKDPKLYEEWKRLTRGRHRDPAAFFRRFAIRYAFSDADHKKFNRAMRKNKEFERVYKDRYAVIYRLREPRDPQPAGP